MSLFFFKTTVNLDSFYSKASSIWISKQTKEKISKINFRMRQKKAETRLFQWLPWNYEAIFPFVCLLKVSGTFFNRIGFGRIRVNVKNQKWWDFRPPKNTPRYPPETQGWFGTLKRHKSILQTKTNFENKFWGAIWCTAGSSIAC